jgi:AraC-like DNA-binding protein
LRLLPIQINLQANLAPPHLPWSIYTVGIETQQAVTRVQGFSANQFFISFAGSGRFRLLNESVWTEVPAASLFYMPAQLPHEYVPDTEAPWLLGYVSITEHIPHSLRAWGFADTPLVLPLLNTAMLNPWMEQIWVFSGASYDLWQTTEHFLHFLLEIKKQLASIQPIHIHHEPKYDNNRSYQDSIVEQAIRFMHDHMERTLTARDLAAFIGYSPKHLNRLFVTSTGMTAMQYMQHIRLQSGTILLAEQPHLTLRQVATQVGMQPAYFSRLFQRNFGTLPRKKS